MNADDAVRREALRQQLLLRTLMQDARATALGGWVRQDGLRRDRAVLAYRANASASAERALASAYPTVQAMLGEENFAQLARAAWRQQAPERGDLAQWGAHLPAMLEANAQWHEWPYLPDAARLDWAVHGAEQAADDGLDAGTLQCLGLHEPQALRLRLQPSVALVVSGHPIVTIWQAHHGGADFAAVREARARRRGEAALVHRIGWRAQVIALDAATQRFMQALLAHETLAAALEAAGADFEFQAWLVRALQLGWLSHVEPVAEKERLP